MNAIAPQYISDLLALPVRTLRSSRSNFLKVPYCRLKTNFIAPHLWNQLPDAIRQAPSLATFKSKLNTFILSSFVSCV